MGFNYSALLNDKQLEAVETYNGAVLILAGAGSGKTRVITFRIAYLLEKGIPQSSILAVTFTNKAAREMASRIRELTRRRLSKLTISTFHAFGVSVLRDHGDLLGFRPNFSIYDSMDKQNLIKETARELGYTRDAIDAYKLEGFFSNIKTGMVKWSDITDQFQALYEEYQHHLKLYNAVDFDDLIVLPIKLFKSFPEVLEAYQKRYHYFMVDEFQDTSLIQYEFIKLIAKKSKNLCVVGDDDQSIYSWRGANYENIINFETDFPEFREVMLEQNYRSTGRILKAANSLIANNTNRKSKNLWTGIEKGEQIQLFILDNEKNEGELIASRIKSIKMQHKLTYADFGVLVRTNSLTRPIEEAFLAQNLPYHVSGGISFFQRKEVKDIISYLRVIANPDDDMNLLRILNVPRRGIGKKSIEQITAVATEYSYSLYSAISALRSAGDSPVSDKNKQILDDFITLIEYYRERFFTSRKMAETLKSLVDKIDYWEYLLLENKKKSVARWKYMNVEGLVNSLADYENDPDNLNPSLYAYLNRITIINRDDEDKDEAGAKINLMTIHSAKGLEFDTVFIAGVEDKLIPHMKSLEENETNIEEERRLFYVAITRARKRLFMTSCQKRRKKGKLELADLSPFIDEIPGDLLVVNKEEEFVNDEAAIDFFGKMKEKYNYEDHE